MMRPQKGRKAVKDVVRSLRNSDYLINDDIFVDEDDPITERITAFERKHVPKSVLKMIDKTCKQ